MGIRAGDRLFVFLFLVVVLARTALLSSSQHHANGDDAAIGVMGHRILEGERPLHPSVADRHAGSALAGYIAAASFAVLGDNETALKVPPLLWSLLALLALYALVRATRGDQAALLAAVFYATSVGLMKWSFYAAGGYVVCQALFCVVFWLLLTRATVPGRARPWHDLLLGFACGLGTALLVLFAPAALTVAVFLGLAGGTRPFWARLARFVAAFAVGCAPLLLFSHAAEQSASHSWLASLGGLAPNLWLAATRHLPAMMSYDNIEGSPLLRVVPNGVAYAVLLSGIILLLALRGSTLGAFLRRARSGDAPGDVPLEAPLLVYAGLYLVSYAAHPFTGGEARHLLPLEPVLSILAALGFFEALGRGARMPLLAGASAALITLAVVNSSAQHARLIADDSVHGTRGPLDPRTAREVAALLGAEGVRHVVTDDWDTSWRMSFHTHGRIVGCHAVAEQREWLETGVLHRTRRYAIVVRAGTHRDRGLERYVRRAGLAVDRRVIRDKAVHFIGPRHGSTELPSDWCPPGLLMTPVAVERARLTN